MYWEAVQMTACKACLFARCTWEMQNLLCHNVR